MAEQSASILIVDDNPEIREIVNIILTGEGYQIKEAADGAEALKRLEESVFDLIILDIMMPGMNGYETCMKMRERSNAPVLFLSARTTDSDKILGFSSGGDDYLAKPFSYSELIGRTKALIRRYQVYQGKEHTEASFQGKIICYKGLEMDLAREEVTINKKKVELTNTEYEMLKLLLTNRKQVFSASRLYETIWKEPYYYGANNTVMVHIRNLRQKIEEDPKNPEIIKTAWGKGYHCD